MHKEIEVAKEFDKSVKIFNDSNKGDTINKVNQIIYKKYSIFWNPDIFQKKMIDEMDEGFRKKMIGCGLKFNENTTEIEIDWVKIVFDKEQPIKEEMNWDKSMETIKTLDWRKWIEKDTLSVISKLFAGRAELLGLNSLKSYWSTTNDTNNAWCAYFNYDGRMTNYTKNKNRNTICIHDIK